MADFQTLLDQAVTSSTTPTQGATPLSVDERGIMDNAFQRALGEKKNSITQASAQKQDQISSVLPQINPDMYQAAAGRGNQMGAASMGELEEDLRTLDTPSLYLKYGADAPELIRQFSAASSKVSRDRAGYDRTTGEALWDTASGIAAGVGNSIGGIAALGGGLLDAELGASITGGMNTANEWVQDTQSEQLSAARRNYEARQNLAERDNEAEYQANLAAGDGELVADFKRVGSDAVDAIANAVSDPTMLLSGTSEGVGSIVGGGVISKGLKAIGRAVTGGAASSVSTRLAAELDRATDTMSAARVADRTRDLASASAWPAAIGAMEGGGVYQQVNTEIMSTPVEQLEQTSQPYRELKQNFLDQGMDEVSAQEQAKTHLANEAGLYAATRTAPIAAGLGTISRIGEAPFRAVGARQLAGDVLLREPGEEALQGAVSGVAENLASQEYVDPEQSLSADVGRQVGEGAAYGVTSAGAIRSPGAAAQATRTVAEPTYKITRKAISSAIEAGKPAFNAIVERGDKIRQQVQQQSPVGDEAMREQAATTAQQTAETAQDLSDTINTVEATPEERAEGNAYVSSLVQSMQFDPESVPENLREVTATATNRVEAIQEVAREVARLPEGPEQIQAAAALQELMQPLLDLKEAEPAIMEKIPEDHEARDTLLRYDRLIWDLEKNASVMRAMRALDASAKSGAVAKSLKPVTERNVNTEEGQRRVRTAVAMAELMPDQGNPEVIEGILKHAEEGRLELTNPQRQALQVSYDLLRERQKLEKKIADSGLQTAKDVVSSQIVASNDPRRENARSALQHTKGIVEAVRGNRPDIASARLEDFGLFVQHMQNKVRAANEHFDNGNPNAEAVPYMSLVPVTREWLLSSNNPKADSKGMYVNWKSAKSVELVKSVQAEQETLVNIYNGLVDAFPELGNQKLEPLFLDPALEGTPQEVVDAFRSGERVVPGQRQAEVTAEPEQQQEQAVVEPTPDPEPEPEGVVDGGVPTMITQAMRAQLRERGLTTADIRKLTPAEAFAEINRPAEPEPEVEEAQPEPEPVVETQPEPEPVQTQPQEEVDTTPEPVEAEPVDTPTTASLDSLYPNLLTRGENFFKKVFRLPNTEEAPTRLIGQEGSPILLVQDALSSSESLTEFMGDTPKYTLTPEIASEYQSLLRNDPKANEYLIKSETSDLTAAQIKSVQSVGGLMSAMSANLDRFLNSRYSESSNKDKRTIRDVLETDADIQRWARGKALNIVDETPEGYQYNPELLETSALAAIQWLLTSNQYHTPMDDSDISAITGVDAEIVPYEVRRLLNEGMSLEQVKRSLASKIKEYWGVTATADADTAYSEGIPEAVAAEMIRAFIDTGMMGVTTVDLKSFGLDSDKTPNRYLVSPMEGNPIHAYPTAIDDAVLINPEEVFYIGDQEIPVAQRQMNNPEVANTEKQKEAIENKQKVPFYLNIPMVNLYSAFGREGMLTLLGESAGDNQTLNRNHAQSIEGKNRTITSAYNHLFDTVDRMVNRAETEGVPVSEMPIRYTYNMSRVGRMQMLGAYNPQSDKAVREAILPTWSTVDLSNENSTTYNHFLLSIGQALDIKVHKQPLEDTVEQVQNLLTGPLVPALDLINDWVSGTDINSLITTEVNPLDAYILKGHLDSAGIDVTPVALNALMEYARLTQTPLGERESFRTSMYLEADGVTNGPINAMVLMTPGRFTPEWIQNISKGGVSIGTRQTMAELSQRDPADLYKTATINSDKHLRTLINVLGRNKQSDELLGNLKALMTLMNVTLPGVKYNGDIELGEPGSFELDRGIAKNPLTILVYGSSISGIAGNLTSQMVKDIYSKMSQFAQAREANPKITLGEALFSNTPNPEEQGRQFVDALNTLLASKIRYSQRNGEYFLEPSDRTRQSADPVEFTFTPAQIQSIRQNMLEGFVKPLRFGIEDTVGAPLMESVDEIRQATQSQSIVLEYLFRRLINERLEDRKKNDPNYRPGDFLSRKDFTAIYKEAFKVSPLVQTEDQAFLIAKTQMLEGGPAFSRALDGTMRTDAYAYAPANAGVAGIPFLTIGMGDANMIQRTSLDTEMNNTLDIFDGINMPLDKITEYSEKANKAVYDSWINGNPFKAVNDSYKQFMESKDLIKDMLKNDMQVKDTPMHRDFTRALFPSLGPKEVASSQAILNMLDKKGEFLQQAEDSISIRRQVMSDVLHSIDHMAGAASPYVNGTVTLDAQMTPEQIADELNARYQEKISGKQQATEEAPVADGMSEDIQKVGREHKASGVRVISWTALKNLGRLVNMTQPQRDIYAQIIRNLGTRDYKIIAGTPEQIAAYQREAGLSSINTGDATVHGVISVAERVIYLINPTTETLIHEMVHASTYETLLSYYRGEKVDPEARRAIERMEIMLNDFLSMDLESGLPNEMYMAFDNARAAIESAQNDLNMDPAASQAKALNEFMAWGLTNEQITNRLKKTKTNKLVQLAKDLWQEIKKLVWGRKHAPKHADDVLSNLQFNTGIIIRTQPNLSSVFQEGTLFHATYGNNTRLRDIRNALQTKIVDLLDEYPDTEREVQQNRLLSESGQVAIDALNDAVSAHFNMDINEATTFKTIVATLATEAKLDSNALAQMQELYTHVTKNLSVDSFMPENSRNPDADRYYAQEKYNTVLGRVNRQTDAYGRTTLLPVFIALSTVNQEFRDILANMQVPKSVKSDQKTMDAALDNLLVTASDSLSNRMSGQRDAANVKAAMDNLMNQITKAALDEQTTIREVTGKIGNKYDAVNDWMVNGMQTLADTGYKLGTKGQESQSLPTKLAGNFLKLASSIASEERADMVSQELMGLMNRGRIWKPFYDLVNNLVDRTEGNAQVYDMIKTVRAAVQQLRQNFRDEIPRVLHNKFSRKLSQEEWSSMYRSMGKTDLAALMETMPAQDIVDLFQSQTSLDALINDLEGLIQQSDTAHWPIYQRKMKQLATFMNTGKTGVSLLRNAYAISNLFGESRQTGWKAPDSSIQRSIDQLITLYAVDGLSTQDKQAMASLVQDESNGLNFVLGYLQGQRRTELRKANKGKALVNHYKGHIPAEQSPGASLRIEENAQESNMRIRGYVNMGPYNGSNVDNRRSSKSYYFTPISGRTAYAQGFIQNINRTASGVDPHTGLTSDLVAGRIFGRADVTRITRRLSQEQGDVENLMPVFDERGQVFAYEQSVDPAQKARLEPESQDLSRMLGVWRGRQVEEKMSQIFNETSIDRLHDMYTADMKISRDKINEYVNLFGSNLNPVQRDAVNLFSDDTRDYIHRKFGDEFWVRKDMLEDAVGYRNPSVGDFWTNSNNRDPLTNEAWRNFFVGLMGPDAYKTLVKGEQFTQNIMSDIRTNIIVRSVVVPVYNFISTTYQLVSRGVPVRDIKRGYPAKLVEINAYVKNRLRQIDLEAELRAVGQDFVRERKLRAEIRSITDSNQRLSIWPLIQAGEFSTIADIGMSSEDLELTTGNLYSYFSKQIDKLPPKLRTAARYGLIMKDTPLFQALQKSVQYSDFVAKAVLYDDLTQRKKMSSADALGKVTTEFVNYDRLPGRWRGYMENMGLLWFYNYKIRIAKIALSTLRNNPLHFLVASTLPAPSSVGLPVNDNIFTQAMDGSLGYSIGPEMGWNSWELNPWYSLMD